LTILETILSAGIVGIGTGLGVSIGNFFSQRMVIRHLEKIENKLKIKKNGEKV
jgi:hypothetical protein